MGRKRKSGTQATQVRLGLCCQFVDEPIKFRTATHRYVSTLDADARRAYLADILLSNANALVQSIETCSRLGIGAFRVNSQLFPLATHPVSGYGFDDLPGGTAVTTALEQGKAQATALDVRLSFHPDQFVVLNSERAAVVESSISELALQGEIAERIGADTLTLHGGSTAGGKDAALDRLEEAVHRLPPVARTRLALENDDRAFTPADLLPFCERLAVPFVYDVHHHRCTPDGMTEDEAIQRCIATWGEREPWTHISSPRDGWGSSNPRPHADFVDPMDFPAAWHKLRLTVDVEAKLKERAVLSLQQALITTS